MTINKDETDCLIFDMDGTLWNATESYAVIWNEACKLNNYNKRISGKDLLPHMGKTLDRITTGLYGQNFPMNVDEFLKDVYRLESELMPKLGGILYDGVREGFEKLSKHYKILLLSNCGVHGLQNFMEYTGLTPYVTDSITFGETQVPKSQNLKIIAERNSLKHPVYVGDTQGDCDETHKAGLPFAYMEYGFGTCDDPQLTFKSFNELTEYFLENK